MGLVLSAGIYEEKLLENTTDEEIEHFLLSMSSAP